MTNDYSTNIPQKVEIKKSGRNYFQKKAQFILKHSLKFHYNITPAYFN